VNITVSLLGGMVSFTLPASVNAAGELVVDTSSVPDLSEWGLGGRSDIDAAIKRINDWFKHKGKKLKPARLRNGIVTLEKELLAAVPATVPLTPLPPTTPLPPVHMEPPASEKPPATGGGWCSLLSIFLLAAFVGVIALGGSIGYVFLGGQPAPTFVAAASPTPSPSPSPSASPSPSPTASPSPSPSPSASPTTSPTSGLQGYISGVCARVVHEGFGTFVSYIDWVMYWYGYDVDHFVLQIAGTNDDLPVDLVYDPADGSWQGRLGLHNAGKKTITQLIAVLDDGTPIDVTDELIQLLGMNVLQVRYPQQDTFGTCPIN
jgi:hypothetical protein